MTIGLALIGVLYAFLVVSIFQVVNSGKYNEGCTLGEKISLYCVMAGFAIGVAVAIVGIFSAGEYATLFITGCFATFIASIITASLIGMLIDGFPSIGE